MLIHLGGIQGAGKDFLIKNLNIYNKIKAINFAELMKKIAKTSMNHDELLLLMDYEKREELRNKVFEYISEQDNAIINGHYALPIRKNNKIISFEKGIPEKYEKIFDGFIYLYEEATEIKRRREIDSTRNRDTKLENIVNEIKQEKKLFDELKSKNKYELKNNNIKTTTINMQYIINNINNKKYEH